MFFDDLEEISKIAGNVGCAIFVVPRETEVEIPGAYLLKPETKTTITIDQVREMIAVLTVKQTSPRFVVIRPADKLGEEAENAILKSLEEPKENVHFVLITDRLSKLLPTILSRAVIYVWRGGLKPINEIVADDKVKVLAKRILAATSDDLVGLAEEIAAKKEGAREFALEVLGVAIEMAYKSYFLTGKKAFLSKIPRLIEAYENISRNGHIKLHLVADLI